MFKAVLDIRDPEVPSYAATVFAVQNDNHGYPMFLIYEKNQWRWKSAKYFRPIGIKDCKI